MNWKFTKAKTIVSLILGVLLFLWASPIISGGFSIFSLIGFLIGFGLTYLIWSLIQKKVESQEQAIPNQVQTPPTVK